MTREEINRKISGLRGEALKDWRLDANWPTLLREMPDPVLTWLGKPFGWECWYKQYDPNWSNYSPDCGEAVCLAWLKWKTQEADGPTLEPNTH